MIINRLLVQGRQFLQQRRYRSFQTTIGQFSFKYAKEWLERERSWSSDRVTQAELGYRTYLLEMAMKFAENGEKIPLPPQNDLSDFHEAVFHASRHGFSHRMEILFGNDRKYWPLPNHPYAAV